MTDNRKFPPVCVDYTSGSPVWKPIGQDPRKYSRKYSPEYCRTIGRRLRMLWLVWRLSRKYPEQRFGQLLINYIAYSADRPRAFFYVEDHVVITRLKQELRS